MDVKIFTHSLAYIALAGALLAAAIALNNRPYLTTQASTTAPAPSPGTLDAELVQCKSIGAEAADDAVCKAVWKANRERFFQAKKLYQDRVTDVVPAPSNLKEPESPSGGELLRRFPPSTRNVSAPSRPSDSEGQPK